MFSTCAVQRLRVGAIYKLLFIGLVTSFGAVGFVLGVLAFFGFDTVSWSGQQVHGVPGGAGTFLGLFLALVFGVMLGSACVLGLWQYSKCLSGKTLSHPVRDIEALSSPTNRL